MFTPDDEPPYPGFYFVRLRRHRPIRALGVLCNAGLWQVFLDGERVADPSLNWKEAFGRLHNMPLLKGQKIERVPYLELVAQRQAERQVGIDHDKPINHNQEKVAI